MDQHQARSARLAACSAGVAVALLLLLPSPVAAARALLSAWAAPVVADPSVLVGPLAGLLAQAVGAWLLLVLALAHGARLPGATGRLLGRTAARLVPASGRRLLELAVGVSLVVGAAPPAGAATVPGSGAPTAAGALSGPTATAAAEDPAGLDAGAAADGPAVVLDHPWTGTPAPPLPPSLPTGSPPEPSSPLPTGSAPEPASADAPRRTAPPPADPAAPATPTTPTTPAPPATPGHLTSRDASAPSPAPVLVEPGDSLWSIARDALAAQQPGPVADARVAQAWPGWWAANRDVVGDDPDLLLPGTRLAPPAA